VCVSEVLKYYTGRSQSPRRGVQLIEPHRGVARLAPISACDERAELAEHPAVARGRRPRDGGGLYIQVQDPAARAPKREREIAAVERGVLQRRDVPGAARPQDGHGELVLHLHLGGGGVGGGASDLLGLRPANDE
jgi:hypothetical protein